MSIKVDADGNIIRDGDPKSKSDPAVDTPKSGFHAEIISIENLKAHGLQIPSVEQLKLKFKPVAVVSFINSSDETDRTDLLCRKIDPLTYNKLSDQNFVRYLAKFVEVQDFLKAKASETEKVDAAELAAVLDPDRILESQFSEDITAYAIASHCIVLPRIPLSQILYTLPISFVNVISEFCIGGVTEFDELIDGFRIEIEYL